GVLTTCAHVLRAGGYQRNSDEEVRLNVDGSECIGKLIDPMWIEPSGAVFPADIQIPAHMDVVVLRLEKMLESGAITLRSLDVSDAGGEVTTFGFPTKFPSGVSAKARLGVLNEARGLRQLTRIDGEHVIDHGFSGGAVWDAKGNVLGMIIARWLPEEND